MAKKAIRIRDRKDLEKLKRGDVVYVCGNLMAFYAMTAASPYPEATFLRPLTDSALELGTPLCPVFRKVLGGIHHSANYVSKTVGPFNNNWDNYEETLRRAELT